MRTLCLTFFSSISVGKKSSTLFFSVFGGEKFAPVRLWVVFEFVLYVGSLHDGEALGVFYSALG